MKLELDPLDLKPEFQTHAPDGSAVDQSISTRDVTFDKLNAAAQVAVLAVGRATFYSWDRQTYNAVYPPTTEERFEKLGSEPEYWSCVVGPIMRTQLPDGADSPMRHAVEKVFRIFNNGKDPEFFGSGWGMTEDRKELIQAIRR